MENNRPLSKAHHLAVAHYMFSDITLYIYLVKIKAACAVIILRYFSCFQEEFDSRTTPTKETIHARNKTIPERLVGATKRKPIPESGREKIPVTGDWSHLHSSKFNVVKPELQCFSNIEGDR